MSHAGRPGRGAEPSFTLLSQTPRPERLHRAELPPAPRSAGRQAGPCAPAAPAPRHHCPLAATCGWLSPSPLRQDAWLTIQRAGLPRPLQKRTAQHPVRAEHLPALQLLPTAVRAHRPRRQQSPPTNPWGSVYQGLQRPVHGDDPLDGLEGGSGQSGQAPVQEPRHFLLFDIGPCDEPAGRKQRGR